MIEKNRPNKKTHYDFLLGRFGFILENLASNLIENLFTIEMKNGVHAGHIRVFFIKIGDKFFQSTMYYFLK